MMLLPLFYLPPVPYLALLNAAGHVYIEAHENYRKSTFRNRCMITGSNGPVELSIPIRGGRDHHHLYSESEMDYTGRWQHRHRTAILSCYGSSPFFEHYMPYLEPFYEQQYVSLFDFNKELLLLLIRLMKLPVEIRYTETYEAHPSGKTDLRDAFRPGRLVGDIPVDGQIWHISEAPYIRVFDIRPPLWSDISSLDLLFNTGPESVAILKQMLDRREIGDMRHGYDGFMK